MTVRVTMIMYNNTCFGAYFALRPRSTREVASVACGDEQSDIIILLRGLTREPALATANN